MISNKEKLAYVFKYASKSDEKLQKIIRLAATMDSAKSKLNEEQKQKVKQALSQAYDKIKSINDKAAPTKTKSSKSTAKKQSTKSSDIKSALSELKQKVGKIEYKRAITGTNIARDLNVPALPSGKRIVRKKGYTTNQYGRHSNKVGSTYYESRANRMDVNQPSKSRNPKLARGGKVEEEFEIGDIVANKETKTIGIVRDVFEKQYGDLRTDADGVVNVSNLELYSPSKHKAYHIAPSTKAEIERTKFAKGGQTDMEVWKEYEENEDNNLHTENVVLLAKHYGSKKDIEIASAIEIIHNRLGTLPKILFEKRDEIGNKLYPKLVKMKQLNKYRGGGEVEKVFMETEGYEYGNGGEMQITESEKKKSLKGNPTFNF
jgi:hypothetical protein